MAAEQGTNVLRPFGTILFGLLAVGTFNASAAWREFRFVEPAAKIYRIDIPEVIGKTGPRSLAADAPLGPRNLRFLDRVVLQLKVDAKLKDVLSESPLKLSRTVAEGIHVLQARDAVVAAEEAERLAKVPGVVVSHPVRKFDRQADGKYAPFPDDPRFASQWNLEARDTNGIPSRVSLNVREAWPISRGEGVVVGVGDDGVELNHPDLYPAALGNPHRNFEQGTTNGNHLSNFESHGTTVAGLAVARGDNGVGMAGVAPQAGLAAWKMLQVSSEGAASVYQHEPDKVWVHNYSWTSSASGLGSVPLLERTARTNAFKIFRGGRGTVIVHAAGNERDFDQSSGRQQRGDANEDGYVNTPGVIPVAALKASGRVASYSNPGACVLVAAPGGETDGPLLFTTDRLGALGLNQISGCVGFTNCADYAFDGFGFTGTSAAAPQIAGLTALILSANTNLAVRDVQQILALSASQPDPNDWDIQTNAAGVAFSHNVGFGLPDAGQAVRLAQIWTNRPATIQLSYVNQPNGVPIPDPGHTVHITGIGNPTNITGLFHERAIHPDIGAGDGLVPATDTSSHPLVDVGQAIAPIGQSLTGKAALIERGGPGGHESNFSSKLTQAANVGAGFGIIFNNVAGGVESLISMNYVDPVSIPSIFISRADGLFLSNQLQTNFQLRVQLKLNDLRLPFIVTNQMLVERVAVKLNVNHSLRRNLRIALTSPGGTTSRLQHSLVCNSTTGRNCISESGPADWTYESVAHLYEPSSGTWTLQFVDDEPGATGTVTRAELFLTGIPITDSDADGLDDSWETQQFINLAATASGDNDGDGYPNSVENVLGSDPNDVNSPFPFEMDLSRWDANRSRLSWFSSANKQFTVEVSDNGSGPYTALTNVPSKFPVTETFITNTNTIPKFYRVRATLQ
ncbi:MAG: hypothetical protein CMO80_06430 [Verrucomicrobiales bacterium]|nr:hypothetical protein [Verrucomicrobiales bacterium]